MTMRSGTISAASFSEEELLELTWVLAEFIALRKVIYVLGIPYGGHAHV